MALYPSLGKCWVLSDPVFVWQLQISSRDEGRKKIFLLLDTRQQSRAVRLVTEKPDGAKSQAAPVEITRKHIPSGHLVACRTDPKNDDIWLQFLCGARTFWFVLTAAKPPELIILTQELEQLVRFGSQGTFTKRKSWAGELSPPENAPDTLPQLLGQGSSDATKPGAATTDPISAEQKELRQKLRRKLKTLRKALAKQQENIPNAAAIDQGKNEALLLQQFLSLIPEGSHHVTITPEQSGLAAPVTLEVNPDHPKARWLEDRFTHVKKMVRALELGRHQVSKIIAEQEAVETTLKKLNEPLDPSCLLTMARRFQLAIETKITRDDSKTERKLAAFKRYDLSLDYYCLLGRSAAENDALTKTAKGDDIWVHAVGVTGSHIIIPTQRKNKTDGIPPQVLRNAAILALHHSKFKDDFAGEVYVTKKANLRKRKGMPAGLWLVERSETMFVRYTKDELDALYRAPTT